ncbi:MAG: hypothetical protein AAF569_05535, partial [Pseudomonadota bacterium]
SEAAALTTAWTGKEKLGPEDVSANPANATHGKPTGTSQSFDSAVSETPEEPKPEPAIVKDDVTPSAPEPRPGGVMA